ncbi:MAG TPA: NBR1-Ig-like domain-containing protein, partial [Kofleriaceae bacterium]|nr:NBR1-Ig-like domain-containing protein [Kofleriaceae bacterium]
GWNGELVAVDLPEMVAPGARAEVVVRMKNTGGETWRPGATFLGTSAPMDRASDLYDEETWVAPNRVATVMAETRPGETGAFAFDIVAPEGERMISETFRLVEDGVSWFGPPIELEVLVSSDMTGVCSAAGGGDPDGLATLALLAAALLPRRRRRT